MRHLRVCFPANAVANGRIATVANKALIVASAQEQTLYFPARETFVRMAGTWGFRFTSEASWVAPQFEEAGSIQTALYGPLPWFWLGTLGIQALGVILLSPQAPEYMRIGKGARIEDYEVRCVLKRLVEATGSTANGWLFDGDSAPDWIW